MLEKDGTSVLTESEAVACLNRNTGEEEKRGGVFGRWFVERTLPAPCQCHDIDSRTSHEEQGIQGTTSSDFLTLQGQVLVHWSFLKMSHRHGTWNLENEMR